MKVTIVYNPDGRPSTVNVELPQEVLDLARALAKLIEAELGSRSQG